MATATETTTQTPTPAVEVKDLRAQIELALLNRINASMAQATAAELREMLALYQEVVASDWYGKR